MYCLETYSILEKVNPELRGFIEFTKRSISLHNLITIGGVNYTQDPAFGKGLTKDDVKPFINLSNHL